MNWSPDEDPACDISGLCTGAADDLPLGITNCIHCGKELREREGQWWTWDAVDRPLDQRRPQWCE